MDLEKNSALISEYVAVIFLTTYKGLTFIQLSPLPVLVNPQASPSLSNEQQHPDTDTLVFFPPFIAH